SAGSLSKILRISDWGTKPESNIPTAKQAVNDCRAIALAGPDRVAGGGYLLVTNKESSIF
ncbi:MAG: hypothetical protein ACO3P8_12500, partial [Steroidobacteraceae bacterium]